MEDDLMFMQSFLNFLYYEKELSDTTIETYQHYLVELASFLERKDSSFLHCTAPLLVEFTGKEAHKNGISRSSRRPMIAAVRGLFRWLKGNNIKDGVNPAKLISYPKPGRPLPVPMSLKNVEKLFSAIDFSELKGLRDAAMIALMVDSGMRLSGLVGLNSSSLVSYTIDDVRRVSIRVLEKGNKERLIPLTDYSLIYLSAYMNNRELKKIDRLLPDGDQVLFVSLSNQLLQDHEFVGEARRLSHRAVQLMLRKYADKVGVPFSEAHPHALRHTFGTEMIESDVDLLRVRDLMGHADVKTTQVYIHLAMNRMFESVDQGSPLSKIETPLSKLAGSLSK